MKSVLVAGLGNPGGAYAETRHNIGFMVLDRLSERLEVQFDRAGRVYSLASGIAGETEILLLRPLTYMNNSGRAVSDLLEARPLPFENVLVVVDDVALPLGTVRIRPGGSDGGHNGLVSVIEHLRSDQFPRLRCGIGEPPPLQSMEEFVLSPFDTSEKTVVREMIARAADAVMEFVSSGIAPAMNEFNA